MPAATPRGTDFSQTGRLKRWAGAIWQRAPPQKILAPAGMAVRPSSRGCSGGRTLAHAVMLCREPGLL